MAQGDVDFTIAMTLKNAETTLPEVLMGIRNIDYDVSRIRFVLVDGGSRDSSVEIVKKFLSEYKQTQKVFLIGNYDILEGRNLYIHHAEGRYLLSVDADVVVPSDILQRLVEVFKNDKIAFVNIPCLIEKSSPWWGPQDTLFDIRKEAQGMSCACFRLSALKQVGAFFRGIPQGENPTELSQRLKSKGYLTVLAPFSARHLKLVRRSLWSYTKTSFFVHAIPTNSSHQKWGRESFGKMCLLFDIDLILYFHYMHRMDYSFNPPLSWSNLPPIQI